MADIVETSGKVVVEVFDIAVTEVIEVGNLGAGPGPEGPPGPPGNDAQWMFMTQAEFDALSVKDPNTLYVIIN